MWLSRERSPIPPKKQEREDEDVDLGGRPSFSIGAFAIIFDERSRVLLCHRQDFEL